MRWASGPRVGAAAREHFAWVADSFFAGNTVATVYAPRVRVALPCLFRSHAASVFVLSVSVLGATCSAKPMRAPCTSSTACALNETCVAGICTADETPGMDASVRDAARHDVRALSERGIPRLSIQPGTASIRVVNGAAPEVTYTAHAMFGDGGLEPVAAVWTVSPNSFGTIVASTGRFVPNARSAGDVTITAETSYGRVSIVISVIVEVDFRHPGAPTDVAARFAGAGAAVTDAARAASLLYPLNATMMPRNVSPPDVQWAGGNMGDLYRVTFTHPRATLRGYIAHTGPDFKYDWPIGRSEWRTLAESTPPAAITWTVERLDSATGQLISGEVRTLSFARGAILGAIYYWELSRGRIHRLRSDGTANEEVVQNPGNGCIACHAVRPDGKRLFATLGEASVSRNAMFDLEADLSANPAPMLAGNLTGAQPAMIHSLSFHPDPTRARAIAGISNGTLELIDTNTLNPVPATGEFLPHRGAQPAWSPDGNTIAFLGNTDTFSNIDFSQSDLMVVPNIAGTDGFGMPRTLITTAAGPIFARPTWSPDSTWIGVQVGNRSRSRRGDLGRIALVRAGDGRVVELQDLNASLNDNYYPTFSPFDTGDFFWLAFHSWREYGNTQAGSRNKRQLWVAAIRKDPTVEPASFAPYWIPLQSRTEDNMAAYWVRELCRADSTSCGVSSECCSGSCASIPGDPDGFSRCVSPLQCAPLAGACTSDADCCVEPGVRCVANLCSNIIIN